MWKSIKNVVSAASDLVIVGSKEVAYQVSKASTATEAVTDKLAVKAAILKARYEADLAERKSGVIKPEVVKETDVPTTVVNVN